MLDDLGFEYLYGQNVHTCSRAHLVSYSIDISSSFARVKRPKCEPKHSPPTSAKVKNKCNSPIHAFMVCIGLTLPSTFLSLTESPLNFCSAYINVNWHWTAEEGQQYTSHFCTALKATSSPNTKVQCFVLSCPTIILSVWILFICKLKKHIISLKGLSSNYKPYWFIDAWHPVLPMMVHLGQELPNFIN